MLNALTWVHWANNRITEKESNVKNKDNGTDEALSWMKRRITLENTKVKEMDDAKVRECAGRGVQANFQHTAEQRTTGCLSVWRFFTHRSSRALRTYIHRLAGRPSGQEKC